MLHIEKYAADCITFSIADGSRNLKKYFFHRLLYIKGHCHMAVPFSVQTSGKGLPESVRLKISDKLDIMKTRILCVKKEKSERYEFYIHCPMQ